MQRVAPAPCGRFLAGVNSRPTTAHYFSAGLYDSVTTASTERRKVGPQAGAAGPCTPFLPHLEWGTLNHCHPCVHPALRTAGRLPHSVAQQSFFQVDYSSDPLMTDPGFRHRLMVEVCKAGLAIEQALGSAQVGGREGLAACLVPGAVDAGWAGHLAGPGLGARQTTTRTACYPRVSWCTSSGCWRLLRVGAPLNNAGAAPTVCTGCGGRGGRRWHPDGGADAASDVRQRSSQGDWGTASAGERCRARQSSCRGPRRAL